VPNSAESEDEDNEQLDPEDKCTSIYFVPQQPASVDAIYQSISACQMLHPPDDLESDNGEYSACYSILAVNVLPLSAVVEH